MAEKYFPGFVVGLGAIVGAFLGFIFLFALLIVQPLEIAMLPRRMWMHDVTIEWALGAFGLCALCSFFIWRRMQSLSDQDPPKDSAGEQTDRAPFWSRFAPEVPGAVWVCPLNTSPVSRQLAPEDRQANYSELCNRYQKGKAIGAAEFPRSFMLQGKLVPLDIMMSGFLFVSDEVAAILKNFDLGQNDLIPLEGIYRGHERTKLETAYSILTLMNRKAAFSADDSVPAAIWQFAKGVPLWGMYTEDYPDGFFAVTETSLDGPDIWKDPATPQQLYVSDRLKAALDDQGIGEKMGFKLCRVVRAE